jgi:hypothetical protein
MGISQNEHWSHVFSFSFIYLIVLRKRIVEPENKKKEANHLSLLIFFTIHSLPRVILLSFKKKSMQRRSFLFLVMIFSIHANAQKNKEWIAVKKEKINFKERYSDFSKNATQFFYLNENLFQKKLAFCSRGQKLKLFLPNGLGGFEWFQIFQYQSLADGLLKKYPSIQSYIGKSDDGHHKTIYFDFSPRGFHGMILTPGKSTTFIDPIGKDHEYYYAYQREICNEKRFFRCLTDNSLSMNNMDSRQANACKNNANQIKSLRLALACTGEYSNYFLTGNEVSIQQKKAIVLSAMNTLIVRINAIFERDLGIHLNLTEGNDNLIFLNELNDPWNHEYNATTQTTIDSIIGIDSYDFGHLLHKENNILNNNIRIQTLNKLIRNFE